MLEEHDLAVQPPSGGCVLKPVATTALKAFTAQPPSGGCVLKRAARVEHHAFGSPAAFGRLCVETVFDDARLKKMLTSRLRAAVC